jgi:glycosyltransferase involved in cell wall biosynthesis
LPKFSIILPVRNGGEYVKECVSSILAQSFTDFDLLVLDNNSTDGTLEWVRSVSDNRVKVYPSQKPLSIEENWGRITSISKNEFITLIGHDDILNSDYLETMNNLISSYPDAGLYQTHFTYIDSKGDKIRSCKAMSEVESAKDFLKKFLLKEIDVMGTGFMMRSKDYDLLGGIPPYPNLLFADFELWINLSKISYKATSAKECFSFRLHQSTTTVSPDTKFHQAFEKFIYFLNSLKNEKESFGIVIAKNAGEFLAFYCRGLSHRLLRTPIKKRSGLTVKEFINNCKQYARLLEIENTFNPDKIFSIRLAKMIDSNAFTRFVFLSFKKVFPTPIMK